MADAMAQLIRRYGGVPRIEPALREIPLDRNPEALAFGEALLGRRVDLLILLTGVGTRSLIKILDTRFKREEILAALRRIVLVARGPKPIVALKELELSPTLTVPEPNTWRDTLRTLDEQKPVAGVRVAVQEYGVPATDLLEGLTQRGAIVTRVPVYRWALPEDTRPLRVLIERIMRGEIDVMLVTNAAQVDHVMSLLRGPEEIALLNHAAGRMVVASIGPTASERLREHGLPVDLEPSHPKMGILVKETSERAKEVLRAKRRIGLSAED